MRVTDTEYMCVSEKNTHAANRMIDVITFQLCWIDFELLAWSLTASQKSSDDYQSLDTYHSASSQSTVEIKPIDGLDRIFQAGGSVEQVVFLIEITLKLDSSEQSVAKLDFSTCL